MAAGIRIGGAVTLESVLAALYDGLRIAALLLCIGAANVLADPKRLLKSLPSALHEIGTAVTIALTAAPQIIESGQRIRRARSRRLTPPGSRRSAVRGILVPVLDDALDRSLALAAAMDSRGYGRAAIRRPRDLPVARMLLLAAVSAVLVGIYGVLDADPPRWMGWPALVTGCALGAFGVRVSGRRVRRTVYRPDVWRIAETMVAACGVSAAGLMFIAESVTPGALYPPTQPPRWPTLTMLPVLAVAAALFAAFAAPPVDLERDAS
jgi:energy-coupling factor transport system permease protein